MVLARMDIEQIADDILADFHTEQKSQFPKTDIDGLATLFLRLSVKYTKLSDNGTLLGLTAYDATNAKITLNGVTTEIHLERNSVLLDSMFLDQYLNAKEVTRREALRRFTLAHECSHQIIFRLATSDIQDNLRKMYQKERSYDCFDLKSKEDWNEWQANTMGAALLMPRSVIRTYFERYQRGLPLISYGGRFPRRERLAISHLMGFFGVSQSMVKIRLKGLGLIVERPGWEYHDPTIIMQPGMEENYGV